MRNTSKKLAVKVAAAMMVASSLMTALPVSAHEKEANSQCVAQKVSMIDFDRAYSALSFEAAPEVIADMESETKDRSQSDDATQDQNETTTVESNLEEVSEDKDDSDMMPADAEAVAATEAPSTGNMSFLSTDNNDDTTRVPVIDQSFLEYFLGYHGERVDYEDLKPGEFYIMQIPHCHKTVASFTLQVIKVNYSYTNKGIILDEVMVNYDLYLDGKLARQGKETQVNTNILNMKPNHFYKVTEDMYK